MARIRSVKPDFFKSEDVAVLSKSARLTWIGLWAQCDDHGRFKDNVRLVKAEVWPLDDDVTVDDVAADLAELAEHGRIVRYTVDGVGYLAVQNWHHHQAINRPGRPKCPPPPVPIYGPEPGERGHCPLCWTTHGGLTEPSVSPHGGLIPGGEGEGKGKEGEGNARERATPPPGSRPRCSRHAHLRGDDPGPPCVACRDARLAAERITAQPTPPPEWCGECDEHTRHIELPDGRATRCRACHPLRSVS